MAITLNDKILIAAVDGDGGAAKTAITVAEFIAFLNEELTFPEGG
jgi:hypothetical protein